MTLGLQGQGQGQLPPGTVSIGDATVPLPAGTNDTGTATTGYSIGQSGTYGRPNVLSNGNGNNGNSNNNINPFSNHPSLSSISLSPPQAGSSSRARTSISLSVKPDVENAPRPALLNTISGSSSSSSFRGIRPDQHQHQYQERYDHHRQHQNQLHDSKYHPRSDLGQQQHVHNSRDQDFPPRTSAPPKDIDIDPTSTLAETTARLSRLERLLSLKDQGYAEKRLRLAEEAVLRLLQVREGEEVDIGVEGIRYEGHSGGGNGSAIAIAIAGKGKREDIETEKMGRSRYDYDESRSVHGKGTGSGDPGLVINAGGVIGMSIGDASSDAEGAMQDEGAVELLGDNGWVIRSSARMLCLPVDTNFRFQVQRGDCSGGAQSCARTYSSKCSYSTWFPRVGLPPG